MTPPKKKDFFFLHANIVRQTPTKQTNVLFTVHNVWRGVVWAMGTKCVHVSHHRTGSFARLQDEPLPRSGGSVSFVASRIAPDPARRWTAGRPTCATFATAPPMPAWPCKTPNDACNARAPISGEPAHHHDWFSFQRHLVGRRHDTIEVTMVSIVSIVSCETLELFEANFVWKSSSSSKAY